MGFFSKILDKLGLRKDKDDEANKPATAGRPSAAPGTAPAGAKPAGPPAPKSTITKTTAQQGQVMKSVPVAMSEVDVVEKLEQMGKGSGLNWKTSIVDLLKLLDIDSSREARVELAKELGAYLVPGSYLEPESGGAAAYWESKEWTDYVHSSYLK